MLAEFDSGLFKIDANHFRPDRTHFLHENCEKGRRSPAVPARFLFACRNGHLDDFPWRWFVHAGASECKGTLRFVERSASLQTADLMVKCDSCDASRPMSLAFGSAGREHLPACRGRHPHLDIYEACDDEEGARTILLGATNGWFPITLSVLSIPLGGDGLSAIVHEGWEYFRDIESPEELSTVAKTLARTGTLPGIERYEPSELWRAIQEVHVEGADGGEISESDIKGPEWTVLTDTAPPKDWPHFLSRKVAVPKGFGDALQDVLLLERLREVNALIGYTRVEAPEEASDPEERPPMAPLSRRAPEWIPASEVHGEGIFIRFREAVITAWEAKEPVKERDRLLFSAHRGWRSARRLTPDEGYPGIRYAMIHTFAHLLARELALECGYNAASIRERIYASADSRSPMAGILLYTAAADSDGTLGGLVELGKPENLGRLMTQALRRAVVCSSDPLCSEHNPVRDRSLHAASCHACAFVSETSCECGNRYLDRALLVGTFDHTETAFFAFQGGDDD